MSETLISALDNDIKVNGPLPAIPDNSVGEDTTATLALMPKDKGGSELEGQVMLWPATDANFATVHYYEYATTHWPVK